MAVLKRLRWLVLGGQVLASWSPEAYSLYGFISLWWGGGGGGGLLAVLHLRVLALARYTQYLPTLLFASWYLN